MKHLSLLSVWTVLERNQIRDVILYRRTTANGCRRDNRTGKPPFCSPSEIRDPALGIKGGQDRTGDNRVRKTRLRPWSDLSVTKSGTFWHAGLLIACGRKPTAPPALPAKSDLKEESEKAGLKLHIQKSEDHGIWSHLFTTNRRGKSGNSDRFYFLELQNHCGQWLKTQN